MLAAPRTCTAFALRRPASLTRLVVCLTGTAWHPRRVGRRDRRAAPPSVVCSACSSAPRGAAACRPSCARRRGVAARAGTLADLGLDSLTFLASVVLVVPLFKALKLSPTLGFLAAGVALDSLGLLRNEENVASLSELGVLFLLFEQGLELSFDRLKALAKYAFGLGLLQVVASTAAFTAFELPVGDAIGTRLLTTFLGAQPDLVNIRSLDEAIVIGAALSLSSSAFVLQVLQERGELATPFGRATLGVLLLQDIAVVPLLVILPLYEASVAAGLESAAAGGPPALASASILATLGPPAAKALLGLGALLLGGRVVLRRVFEVVASARSTEAFVALCLLTVTGTSLLTQRLGFSDTLGAFLAGVLLAETNYRAQVETEIRPFRGLLLGLFFVTTGTSIDLELLAREWPEICGLVVGLVAVKTTIVAAAGPLVGLSRAESVRTGLLVGQGGEFAFVIFSLANTLGVLPLELNRLLIIVVVASMALTPVLAEAGARAFEWIERQERASVPGGAPSDAPPGEAGEPSVDGAIVLAGFGPPGQAVASLLRARVERSPACFLPENASSPICAPSFVAFDLDPRRVQAAVARGFPVLYGDASRPDTLRAARLTRPAACVVAYADPQRSLAAVASMRAVFGDGVPIHARARDPSAAAALRQAGASVVVVDALETGLLLAHGLLRATGETEASALALSAAARAAVGRVPGGQATCLLLPSDMSFDELQYDPRPDLDAAVYAAAARTRVAPSATGGGAPAEPQEQAPPGELGESDASEGAADTADVAR